MRVSRLLVVPAAGAGSRLGAGLPKLLVPVAGRPMIDRILDLYRDYADRVAVVVNPAFASDVRRHLDARPDAVRADCVEQASPTGMLDAILLALPAVSDDVSSVWVTWCDQIAVHPRTVAHLAAITARERAAPFAMPTVRRTHPYVHFERDAAGRITRVLHRREGDPMPDTGESDIGVFAMSPAVFTEFLPRYAAEVEPGEATRERNFLPFIPWLARTHAIVTFPCEHPMEAVGVNTPDEMRIVEEYLRERDSR
jgi:bifunctional N-acetylglucosamine-1-phosphate-uridyltransferase/glucosamine-1-phosphate-acetyltransferase GlmU-like protein